MERTERNRCVGLYIPKADGRQRPLGVTALEDKIVQRSTVEVLNAIYETDFFGFSYGFRPGRSPHNALDAIYVGIMRKNVNWLLDAGRLWFLRCHPPHMALEVHRASDRRSPVFYAHIKKWLNAGIMEDGKRTEIETRYAPRREFQPSNKSANFFPFLEVFFAKRGKLTR